MGLRSKGLCVVLIVTLSFPKAHAENVAQKSSSTSVPSAKRKFPIPIMERKKKMFKKVTCLLKGHKLESVLVTIPKTDIVLDKNYYCKRCKQLIFRISAPAL